MSDTRKQNIREILSKKPVALEEGFDFSSDFASDVFNLTAMRLKLPGKTFAMLENIIRRGAHELIDRNVADQVAHAMKEWALERGATHYCHLFQPMTGLTAEKHDCFLSKFDLEGRPLLQFSGSELIRGEPDASSFPSGGIRSTFEARGYTVWDPVSPAFIRRHTNGTVLCIPTAFISWTGAALDHKTPLLRSEEAISREGVRLLAHLGQHANSIYSNLGLEQEFFLVDRSFVVSRPDLLSTGRTLIGARPPKGQELEDHYFGSMNERILACIQEVEIKLWKLGVPMKTRHNEVAPAQYEVAPIFERSSLAVDHNMLTMEILRETAQRHGLEVLFHEKPFAGVNGSGKHNNWSMSTDGGDNLLDPGHNPSDNLRFVTFLAAVFKAVDDHANLLRVSIATPANDHRLGANEAPPAIVSIFLGSFLSDVVKQLTQSIESEGDKTPFLDLGVSSLPPLPRDMTDRNRTSPFAFTGNKFEFRAVGSAQNCSAPVCALNTAVANAMAAMNAEIETIIAHSPSTNAKDAVKQVAVSTLKRHLRVAFDGNGYSKDWHEEAAKRGLPNLKTTPDALATLMGSKHVYIDNHVLSEVELKARYSIALENYVACLSIEAATMIQLAETHVLSAALKQQKQAADALIAVKQALPSFKVDAQESRLQSIATLVSDLIEHIAALKSQVEKIDDHEEILQEAFFCANTLKPAMAAVRQDCDMLETMVDDNLWPLPKYSEMLMLR